jgi:hypothetical protein
MPHGPLFHIPSVRAIPNFDDAFDRAFSLVAFAINRHLVDHWLRSALELTGGDYEALVIWGVLAHQNVAHLMPPGIVPSAVLDKSGLLHDGTQSLRPLMLRDLAAIAGIPRETTRRKLEKLLKAGYVERSGKAWVVSTGRLEPDLRGFTRETTWRLLAVADQVRIALADGGQQAAADQAAAASTTTPISGGRSLAPG